MQRLIIISSTAEAINSFINFDFHSDPITLRKLKQGDRFLACRTLKKSTHTYDYQDGQNTYPRRQPETQQSKQMCL